MAPLLYSVDTSALLDGRSRYYPETTFVRLWEQIDGLIDEKRFFASEEVFEELKARDDDVKNWVGDRSERFLVATDDSVAAAVKEILAQFPRLVGELKGRNRADAFVIAVARQKGAAVVTGERGGTVERPKIPYVCGQLDVECITFLAVVTSEGWKYP